MPTIDKDEICCLHLTLFVAYIRPCCLRDSNLSDDSDTDICRLEANWLLVLYDLYILIRYHGSLVPRPRGKIRTSGNEASDMPGG